jgi:hypothetical protein
MVMENLSFKIWREALSVHIYVICGRFFLRGIGQSDKGRGRRRRRMRF